MDNGIQGRTVDAKIGLLETINSETGQAEQFFLLDSQADIEQEILRRFGNNIEIRKERLLSNEEAKEGKFRSRPSNTHRYDVFLDDIKIGVAKGGYLYVLDKQIILLAEKALK